jgi:hypothetical protein
VPTVANLLSTVRAAGFPRADLITVYDGDRGIIRADKGPHTACKVRNEDIFISIDTPRRNQHCQGETEISGWTVSQLHANQEEMRIYAYLDTLDEPQSKLGMAEYPLPRADIAPPYGDRYTTSGFKLKWTPPHLSGEHILHILVDAPYGWNFRSVSIVLGDGATGAPADAVTPLPVQTAGNTLMTSLARLENFENLQNQERANHQETVARLERAIQEESAARTEAVARAERAERRLAGLEKGRLFKALKRVKFFP